MKGLEPSHRFRDYSRFSKPLPYHQGYISILTQRAVAHVRTVPAAHGRTRTTGRRIRTTYKSERNLAWYFGQSEYPLIYANQEACVLFASVVSSNTPPQLKPVYTVFKIAMKLEKSYDCLLKVKPNLLSDFIVARQPQALMSCINKKTVLRTPPSHLTVDITTSTHSLQRLSLFPYAQVLACDQAFSSILSGAFH